LNDESDGGGAPNAIDCLYPDNEGGNAEAPPADNNDGPPKGDSPITLTDGSRPWPGEAAGGAADAAEEAAAAAEEEEEAGVGGCAPCPAKLSVLVTRVNDGWKSAADPDTPTCSR
jgi:hypothetical protein